MMRLATANSMTCRGALHAAGLFTHGFQKINATVAITVLLLSSRFLLRTVGTQRIESDNGAFPLSFVS